MTAIGVILLVVFIIVSVLLILLVLVQDDGQNGMGGLLGGRGTAAFGSHSASVLTKATAVLVFLFFALALSLAVINKKPATEDDLAPSAVVETPAETTEAESSESAENSGAWWENSAETDASESEGND